MQVRENDKGRHLDWFFYWRGLLSIFTDDELEGVLEPPDGGDAGGAVEAAEHGPEQQQLARRRVHGQPRQVPAQRRQGLLLV